MLAVEPVGFFGGLIVGGGGLGFGLLLRFGLLGFLCGDFGRHAGYGGVTAGLVGHGLYRVEAAVRFGLGFGEGEEGGEGAVSDGGLGGGVGDDDDGGGLGGGGGVPVRNNYRYFYLRFILNSHLCKCFLSRVDNC